MNNPFNKKCAVCKKEIRPGYNTECVICHKDFCARHYLTIENYDADRIRRKISQICYKCARKAKIISKEIKEV